jgi:hypothetical protein
MAEKKNRKTSHKKIEPIKLGEKTVDESEELAVNPTVNKKHNKQLFWAIVLMVSVIVLMIIGPIITGYVVSQNNKFVYAKLDWQKTQASNMVFYSTKIPVTDKYLNVVGSFFINFRNDPRELNKTNFTLTTTTMPTFNKEKVVYISIGEMKRKCLDGSAATLTLAGFFRQFANMNISGAMSNKTIANDTGFPYITCQNSKMNTVINIIEGNTTEIRQINYNCYELRYANCEVMKVSERFILEVIEGYMGPFKKQ